MSLHLYRRGRIWHYRGTVAGRRLRGSTGTASKETAQRLVVAREAREWKGHIDGPAAVLTFAQAAILYRAARKSDRFLKKIEDHWQNALVKDITDGAIRAAAMILYPTAGPPSWNRQVIVPTQAVINHAASLGHCQRIRVPRFKIERREKEPVTREWLAAFMAAASPRVGALACFMFGTAARVSEALAVTWADVDLSRRKALIRQTKVGDERWAHLPPPLVAALASLPGEREGSLFGFRRRGDCWTQWRSAIKRAGIAKLGYHACRHGFATTLLHEGVDVKTVAQLGGWKTPALVLSTYGHAMRDPTVTDRLWADTSRAQRDKKKSNINRK